jgi:serine/threonine protein kinase
LSREVFDRKGFGTKIDIWSAGAVLFRLVAGELLEYRSTRDKKKLKAVIEAQIGGLVKRGVKGDVVALLRGMLEVEPEKRMSAEQTLEIGWIRQFLEKHPEQRRVSSLADAITESLEFDDAEGGS